MLNYKFKQRKVKKNDRQKRIAVLDTVFSLFVRLRDCDKNGIVKCITCGSFIHWQQCDAGHFVTRDNMGCRWEEENVNGQCQQCNRFKSGKQYEHGLAIDKKYKPGTASLLMIKGKSVCNFQEFEIEQMIAYYKLRVKELKIEKGILTKD